jgi:hypothetical protein
MYKKKFIQDLLNDSGGKVAMNSVIGRVHYMIETLFLFYKDGRRLRTEDLGEEAFHPTILPGRFCSVLGIDSVKGIGPYCVKVSRGTGMGVALHLKQNSLHKYVRSLTTHPINGLTLATLQMRKDSWESVRVYFNDGTIGGFLTGL